MAAGGVAAQGTHTLTLGGAAPRLYQKGSVTSLQQAWSPNGRTCSAQETSQSPCWAVQIRSNHLLSLFDLGEASVKDGALVCEVDAIELLRNLLSDQLLRPAVWAINDDQPSNKTTFTLQLFRSCQVTSGCMK